MSRARRLALELLQLALISCGAGGLIAALLAFGVGAIDPSQAPAAFLLAAPLFAVLVFAAALLIELIVPEPEVPPCSE